MSPETQAFFDKMVARRTKRQKLVSPIEPIRTVSTGTVNIPAKPLPEKKPLISTRSVWEELCRVMGTEEPMLFPQVTDETLDLYPVGDQRREEQLRDVGSVLNGEMPSYGTHPSLLLKELQRRVAEQPNKILRRRQIDKDWAEAKDAAVANYNNR